MRGRVLYNDGQPRPGTTVSDGVSVTTTAYDGTFELSTTGAFVFVSRPAGLRCDRWFVPSTADNVEFVLEPDTDLFPHKFIHISDIHLGSGPYYPKPVELGGQSTLTDFLSRIPEVVDGLSSVIATGDLTDRGIDDEYEQLKAAVSASPLPLHLLPGNHDHMGGEIVGTVSRNNYAVHTADPSAYEKHLGPRWYSFDLPGLHVIALDWHTHELGIDHLVQNAWMAADLESIPATMPWILLSHDQPWYSILDAAPRAPIATFSGHRHTSRVVQVGGTLHVNTPTPLMAGLDFSPPSFRVVRWDGEAISLDTRTLGRTGLEKSTFSLGSARPRTPSVRWQAQLPGSGHRSAVQITGDVVLAAVKDEDRAAGGVQAISKTTGELLWYRDLGSAVKSTPAIGDSMVIAVAVSGDVTAMRICDGTVVWHVPSPDPLRLFAFAPPMVQGDHLVVGVLSELRCLDTRTGELRWERTDMTPYQTHVDHIRPVIVGQTLIAGSWPAPDSLVGLDLATGATLWPEASVSSAVEDTFNNPSAPVGTPLFDEVSGDLYVSTIGALVRIDLTGRSIWTVPMGLPWNPASPVSTPYGIAMVDPGAGVVTMIDRAGGDRLWSTPVGGTSPFAMSSYQRTPHVLFAEPAVLDELLLVPTLDGAIHVLDAASGARRGQVTVGAPVAGRPVVDDDGVYVIDTDGRVSAFDAAVFREVSA